VAAISAGTVITLVWDIPGARQWFPKILAERDAIFPALFVAVAAMVVVSVFTPAPEPKQLAQFSD
jgi:SSS family solute:Na+ symporter/sodium/proline symporter